MFATQTVIRSAVRHVGRRNFAATAGPGHTEKIPKELAGALAFATAGSSLWIANLKSEEKRMNAFNDKLKAANDAKKAAAQ